MAAARTRSADHRFARARFFVSFARCCAAVRAFGPRTYRPLVDGHRAMRAERPTRGGTNKAMGC